MGLEEVERLVQKARTVYYKQYNVLAAEIALGHALDELGGIPETQRDKMYERAQQIHADCLRDLGVTLTPRESDSGRMYIDDKRKPY